MAAEAKKNISIRVPEPEAPPPPSEPQSFRRFGRPDLEEMGLWLLGRLRERYPSLEERSVIGWLRGAMETNGFLFLRSGNAVGLAQVNRKPLDPNPFVEEVFVLCQDGFEHEGLGLYERFKTWAVGMGAAELHVGNFSDVEKETVAKSFGRVTARSFYVVKLKTA